MADLGQIPLCSEQLRCFGTGSSVFLLVGSLAVEYSSRPAVYSWVEAMEILTNSHRMSGALSEEMEEADCSALERESGLWFL